MASIKQLLGTKNRREQEKLVEGLLQATQTPVIDLVIRYDPFTDRADVTLIGGNVDFEAAYHILELGRKVFQQREIQQNVDRKLAEDNGHEPDEEIPDGK